MVQRIDTSPGRAIPFSLQVQCFGEATVVHVRPVNLVQQENGLILPDDRAPPPQQVELSGGEERILRPYEATTIRGRITAPLKGGTFYPFGILVTDLGRPWETGVSKANAGRARMTLQFVTRYLARLEMNVLGFGGEDASRLQLLDGRFVQRDGMPWISVAVRNPTESAQTFSVQCRIRGTGTTPAAPSFPLMMPIRAAEEGERRLEAVMLAGSRIVMEAPVPEPIFPGPYQLEMEILHDGKIRRSERFAVSVGAGEFPRQDAQEALILDAVRVAPAQIAFSLRPQGNRLLPLVFQNTSTRPVQVRLSPQAIGDAAHDWFAVRPEAFTLAPQGRRNVLASVRVGNDINSPRYCLLRAEIHPDGATKSAWQYLPVALTPQAEYPPDFELGKLRYAVKTGRAVFIAPLSNRGATHLPLQATLTVTDALGRRLQASGGFGKWVLPGQTSDLEFPSPRLPPGSYQAVIEITPAADAEPQFFRQNLEVW